MFEKVILHVKKYQQIANPANETGESDLTDWLKSFKDRVQPQGECDSNLCKEIREAIIDLILDNIDNGVLFHKGVDCQDMIRFLENK